MLPSHTLRAGAACRYARYERLACLLPNGHVNVNAMRTCHGRTSTCACHTCTCTRTSGQQVRRLITLVDAFYDSHVRLIIRAAVPTDELFKSESRAADVRALQPRRMHVQPSLR